MSANALPRSAKPTQLAYILLTILKWKRGERDISIEAADKLAKYFGLTLDELVHMNGKVLEEVTIEDKSVSERIKLIQQLEEEDKKALFRIIDSMFTKSKFKDFFQKNVAAL